MASFKRLQPRFVSSNPNLTKCILLDVSGSMDTIDQNQHRRIDLLRKALAELDMLNGIKMVAFGSYCDVCDKDSIPEPHGSTDMAAAFLMVKKIAGHIILITDGLPDNEKLALDMSRGLTVDIIYIGPGDMPKFLIDLAATCHGQAAIGHLKETKLLQQKIAGLLT